MYETCMLFLHHFYAIDLASPTFYFNFSPLIFRIQVTIMTGIILSRMEVI